MSNEIKKFEVGKVYETCSIGDTDLKITGKVIKRTASTVTIHFSRGSILEPVKTLRIRKGLSEFCKAEAVSPWGVYSMSPVLDANDEIAA